MCSCDNKSMEQVTEMLCLALALHEFHVASAHINTPQKVLGSIVAWVDLDFRQ